MPKFPSFIGGSYPANSLLVSQRTTNFYVEQNQEPGAENASMLLPTPGFSTWATVPEVESKQFIVANGRMFGVVGNAFYEFETGGVATKRNTVTLAQDSNPAQLAYNGVIGGQIGIASGGSIYSYDMTTNLVTATTLTGGYTHLSYAGGYGLAFNPTTGKTNISALENFTTWDASTFFRRSLFADPALAMFVDSNNLVWIVGTDSFEVRYNTGSGADQPFEPLSGLVGRYGIVGGFAYSVTGAGNFWLARNPEGAGQLILTKGSSPTPVTTYAINAAIAGYLRTSDLSNTEMMCYQQEGHTFALPSFPTAKKTWAYDIEGQSWTERGKWDSVTGTFMLWTPRVHCQAFGKHLVGDRTTGIISVMDTNLTTEVDGTGIVRERIAPMIYNEGKRIPIDRFELVADVGLGTASGQGSDPQALLSISQDAGNTWGNERRASMGRMGKYRTRVYWTRCGSFSNAVFRVRWSDPAPTRIVDALVNSAERAA